MTASRINIFSSPRNISTALMYSFAQRADMTVRDEPLYAHYLRHTNTEAEHPGTPDILAAMENDGEKVTRQMLYGDYPTPHVMFKQMTHHLIELREDFLYEMKNVLLIRDPRRIITSYAKVIDNPTIDDIGVKKQAELYQKLKAGNALNAVVDSKQLLLNPPRVLRQLCEKLEIPFTEKMLTWPAGARPEDGVWAKYWYTNVHQSTGFMPYAEKEVQLTPALEALAEECAPYYAQLERESLRG